MLARCSPLNLNRKNKRHFTFTYAGFVEDARHAHAGRLLLRRGVCAGADDAPCGRRARHAHAHRARHAVWWQEEADARGGSPAGLQELAIGAGARPARQRRCGLVFPPGYSRHACVTRRRSLRSRATGRESGYAPTVVTFMSRGHRRRSRSSGPAGSARSAQAPAAAS